MPLRPGLDEDSFMSRMSLIDSLRVLHDVRKGHHVVVSTMGPAREWMKLGSHSLDFIYAPSAMGEAPSLALGMSLAQPAKHVIVLNGDGCMLMNLGCLVTITAAAPVNYTLIVFDNSVYEVTGGQSTAAAPHARPPGSSVDFCQIARGSGFASVWEFTRLDDWRKHVAEVLAVRGPRVVVLKVEPVSGGAVPRSPAPPVERAQHFAAALQRP
jgi:thiamine pyrophosphate-dependent acetolactate synthase large subunit-like protein